MRRIATMMSGDADERRTALFGALRRDEAGRDAAPELAGSLIDLLQARPTVVLAGGSGLPVLRAVAYRLLRRDTRLLLWVRDAPSSFQLLARLAIAMADGVLAGNDRTADAIAARFAPAERIFAVPGPYPIGIFAAGAPSRGGEHAHRLVYRGALTPESGAAELLAAAAVWAERNPAQPLDIWWIGEGDLRGVLEAQPLPDNLSQAFLGPLTAEETAWRFRQCGVLVVQESVVQESGEGGAAALEARVAEGMASGLVVLGERHCRSVAALMREDETGWSFDMTEPESFVQAVDLALGRSAEELDIMRAAARMRVLPMDPQGFHDRVGRALETVMRGPLGPPDLRGGTLGASQSAMGAG